MPVLPPRPGYIFRNGKYVPDPNPATNPNAKGPVDPRSLPGGDDRGPRTTQTPQPFNPKQAAAMAAFLRSKGYHIPENPGASDMPMVTSAQHDWLRTAHHTGARDAKTWNLRAAKVINTAGGYGNTNSAEWGKLPAVKVSTAVAPKGPKTPPGTPGGTDAGGGPTYKASDFTGGSNTGTPLDPGLATSMGASLLPTGMADSLAGGQFDPQIQDARVAIARAPQKKAQDLADIKNWYGAVQGSLGKANERNQAAAGTAQKNSGDAAAAVLASLGGSANGAAGMVGEAGAADSNLLGQLGTAEANYQNDLAPILQDEQAGASRNQLNAENTNAQNLALQLASLQGQRGQAKNAALMQIMQANNTTKDNQLQQLLNIKQYNNNLNQQNWSNQLSGKEAAISAAMTGAQIAGLNAQTAQATTAAGGFTPWAKLQAPDRGRLVDAALANVIDPSKAGALLGTMTPDQAMQSARNYLVGQGYTSARQAGNKWVGPRNSAAQSMNLLLNQAINGAIARRTANNQAQAAVNG